jgi:GxxExxY protein
LCPKRSFITKNDNDRERNFKNHSEEAIYIHKSIGPGMLESAYVHCLAYRPIKRGLNVKTQVAVPLIFEEVRLDVATERI